MIMRWPSSSRLGPQLLHDFHTFGSKIGLRGRWQPDLGAGGKHEPALPQGVGMQQQWQPRAAEHGQQALQPTVVVGVAVRQHYRPQDGGRHIEHSSRSAPRVAE
jgi:hypothetical protein